MFLGCPASGVQNAMVKVMESPKWANVPLVPLKRAWTWRMGSIHEMGLGRSLDPSAHQAVGAPASKSDQSAASFTTVMSEIDDKGCGSTAENFIFQVRMKVGNLQRSGRLATGASAPPTPAPMPSRSFAIVGIHRSFEI